MRIGLIDVDGHNYPNLALMKLSAAFCTGCETAFDSDSICIESNGEVWMKCPPEGAGNA